MTNWCLLFSIPLLCVLTSTALPYPKDRGIFISFLLLDLMSVFCFLCINPQIPRANINLIEPSHEADVLLLGCMWMQVTEN